MLRGHRTVLSSLLGIHSTRTRVRRQVELPNWGDQGIGLNFYGHRALALPACRIPASHPLLDGLPDPSDFSETPFHPSGAHASGSVPGTPSHPGPPLLPWDPPVPHPHPRYLCTASLCPCASCARGRVSSPSPTPGTGTASPGRAAPAPGAGPRPAGPQVSALVVGRPA